MWTHTVFRYIFLYFKVTAKLLNLLRAWGFVMDNQIKKAHLKLRLSQEQKELIRQAAYSKGLSMSSYIRLALSEQTSGNMVKEEKTNFKAGGKSDERY